MKTIPRLLGMACALAFASTASAFVQFTTTPYPDQGSRLQWKRRTVAYAVNMSAFTGQGCSSGDAASQLAQASFPAWAEAQRQGATAPCTDFKFVYAGETARTDLGYDATKPSGNINLVVFRRGSCTDRSIVPADDACVATPGACAAKYNCWEHGTSSGVEANTLALTTVTYDTQTGEILDADMELNGWSGDTSVAQDGKNGWYFTCGGPGLATCGAIPYGQSACNWRDVGNTITHEAGHMLGLDHVCMSTYPPPYNACPWPVPVMAPTSSLGETVKRVLTPDDVEAVCTIYPAGGSTQAQSTASSGCGAGRAGAGALVAGLVLCALRGCFRARRRA